MTRLSRRAFIGGAAAAGAVTVTAGVPGIAGAAGLPSDRDGGDLPTTTGPVVARVRDARTGEITLYAGTEEITYTDRVLARRLVRAAAR